jgi:hypothetical protein
MGELPASSGRGESAARAFRQTGRIGRETVGLVSDCVRDVVERYNFPPIYGQSCWDEDAIEETVQEFCAAKGRTLEQRLTHIAVQSVGNRDFIAQLREAVANHIRSELRRSQRGRLAMILRELLRKSDDVLQSPKDFFTLRRAETSEITHAAMSDLVAAARAVEDVKVIRWRPDSTNAPPIAERADLLRICVAVLAAASAPVHLSTLIEVLSHRFDLRDAPTTVNIDEIAATVASPLPEAASDRDDRAHAVRIWNQMTVRERQVFPLLADSARDIGAQLGVSKSAVADLKIQVKDTLRCGLPADPGQAELVLHELGRLARLPAVGHVRLTGRSSTLNGGGTVTP